MVVNEFLETPVCGGCDVLVCGGGFAGISAALAAADAVRKRKRDLRGESGLRYYI